MRDTMDRNVILKWLAETEVAYRRQLHEAHAINDEFGKNYMAAMLHARSQFEAFILSDAATPTAQPDSDQTTGRES